MILKAQKPKHFQYPKELKTLGDHIRRRRLDLGLFQREVARKIEVDRTTIYNWERNATSPQVHQLPGVIRFLGYDPLLEAESLPEKLLAVRRRRGLTQKAFAKRLGVDPGTLRAWEIGKRRPSKKVQRTIDRFVTWRGPGVD